jgi:hypothetical protein
MHGQQNTKFKQTLLFEVLAEAEEMVDDINQTMITIGISLFPRRRLLSTLKSFTKLRRSLTVCCVKYVKSH